MINAKVIQEIKARTNLLKVFENYGHEVYQKGNSYKAKCLFHEEQEPSLSITPKLGLWQCFGCGAAGDVFKLVQKKEGISFLEAVKKLAKEQGLSFNELEIQLKREEKTLQNLAGQSNLKETSARVLNKTSSCSLCHPHISILSSPRRRGSSLDSRASSEKAKLLAEVSEYYHESFLRSEKARNYLQNRGINNAKIYKDFKLGFCDGSFVKELEQTQQFEKIKALYELGVILENGKERFLNCVVFPLFKLENEHEIASFYGRHVEMESGGHFYLPGPRDGLFGLAAIKKTQHPTELVITESIIDALSFVEHDLPNVLAMYGTNGFTKTHEAFVRKLPPQKIILALDGDEAGFKAAKELKQRLNNTSNGVGFKVEIVQFPENQDANEYFMNHSKGDFLTLLSQKNNAQQMETRRGEPMCSPDLLDQNRHCERSEAIPQSQKRDVINNVNFPDQGIASQARNDRFLVSDEGIASQARNDTLDSPTKISNKYCLKHVEIKSGKLMVTIKIENKETQKFILDTVNLYAGKQREQLINDVAKLLNQSKSETELEIAALIKIAEGSAAAGFATGFAGRVVKKTNNPDSNEENPDSEEPEMSETERAEALKFLKSDNIFKQIQIDYETLGYIGEETNKILAYLVMTSRKMKSPLSLIIMSNSAAGKSSLQTTTMKLCPSLEGKHFTRLTQQSLYYLGEESLKHKFLSIEEEEGSSEASYSLKTLLSAKVLNIASTSQDPQTGKRRADEYKTEGPVAVMVSTTSPELEAELASRTLVISIDESHEQTNNIQVKQKDVRTKSGQLERLKQEILRQKHQNAQKMLRQNLVIVNEYAPQLSFPCNRLRFRRSHEHYLDLIETIGFLRQFQKTIKEDEILGDYIEIDKADIKLANDLFVEIMGWSLDELRPSTRGLLKQIVGYCKENGVRQFSRREIREAFKLDNATLARHLDALAELEYVVVKQGTNGVRYLYELIYEGDGENSEKFVTGLKRVEELTF